MQPSIIVALESPTDWPGFQRATRALVAENIHPDLVHWQWHAADSVPTLPVETPSIGRLAMTGDLFTQASHLPAYFLTPDDLQQNARELHPAWRVPREVLRQAQSAVLNHLPTRFHLLYRWLWRMRQQPALARDPLDPDAAEVQRLVRQVRRDIHKMRAFVRFRPVEDGTGRTRHIAWFEPEHHIVAANAPFFVRRFAQMHWVILTPDCCAEWDGRSLQFSPGAQASDAPPADAAEALWLTYYASIFNPARLKEQAMRNEMPRKYWKNLPEAQLISGLVAQARSRTERMLSASANMPPCDFPYRDKP